MSTYGFLFERKESGAPQSAGNVVAVNPGSANVQPFGWKPAEALGGRWEFTADAANWSCKTTSLLYFLLLSLAAAAYTAYRKVKFWNG